MKSYESVPCETLQREDVQYSRSLRFRLQNILTKCVPHAVQKATVLDHTHYQPSDSPRFDDTNVARLFSKLKKSLIMNLKGN